MIRNVGKLINEYDNTFIKEHSRKGAIYYTDLEQIKESSNSTWDLIYNSIRFGVMIGYKVGKQEARS